MLTTGQPAVVASSGQPIAKSPGFHCGGRRPWLLPIRVRPGFEKYHSPTSCTLLALRSRKRNVTTYPVGGLPVNRTSGEKATGRPFPPPEATSSTTTTPPTTTTAAANHRQRRI